MIALADLVEAEGRELKMQAVRLSRSLALVVFAILLAAAGAGLLLWAIYQGVSASLGSAGGALVSGLVGLAAAGVVIWVSRLSIR